MSLKKYDVVRVMIPFSTEEDRENGYKTLNFNRSLEAELSGNYKKRPCIVVGSDKESGNVILAEIRTNRDKKYRSMLNDPAEAGIEHESSILIKKDQLVHVESDISQSLESLKCGHLSDKDIARFKRAYMEVNYNQHVPQTNQRQHETLEERERRIERELDEHLASIETTPRSGPTNKDLLNKLEAAESNLNGSNDHVNDYER